MTVTQFVVGCLVIIPVRRAVRNWRDAQLLKNNPETWKALKEEEANKKERKRLVAPW